MGKLNKKRIRWIIKEHRKGKLSVYRMALLQDVTPRHVRRIIDRYKDMKLYRVGKEERRPRGRPPKQTDENERRTILQLYEKTPICAVKMEKYHELLGIPRIPHNRIQRILSEAGFVIHSEKKIRRNKWVRYERKHSNSLWHADFTEDDEGKQILPYVDDASRLVTSAGKFDTATTDNALKVLDEAIKRCGSPKQIMTDHGSQFCSNEEKVFRFAEELKKRGIEHIMAAVKRPQGNGKVERWFGSTERLYLHFGRDLQRTVECYNNLPHLSLDTTPLIAFEAKMHKE